MYDFRKETFPFTATDTDGDTVVITSTMGLGAHKADYLAFWSDPTDRDDVPFWVNPFHNDLKPPADPRADTLAYLKRPDQDIHRKALRAFYKTGAMTSAISFVRAIVPKDVRGTLNHGGIRAIILELWEGGHLGPKDAHSLALAAMARTEIARRQGITFRTLG